MATLALIGLTFTPLGYASSGNPWLELGECEVDYTENLPDFFEEMIDSFIAQPITNYLEPTHPDAYLKVFQDSSEAEQIGSTIYRGFFAQGNEKWDWYKKMFAWFVLFGKVVYVNGEVLDNVTRDNCSIYHADFEWKNGITTLAGQARWRFDDGDRYEPNYHLFVRNCQHFSHWVLTGFDYGR